MPIRLFLACNVLGSCVFQQVEIDVEAEVREAEEREAAAAAAEQLRDFDRLLAERERQRQIDQGMRWKP